MFSKKFKLTVSAIVLLTFLCFLLVGKSRLNESLSSWDGLHMNRHFYYLSTALNTSLYQQQSSLDHRTNTSKAIPPHLRDTKLAIHEAMCSSLYGESDKQCCGLPHCWDHLSEFDRACVKWCNKKAFYNYTETMMGECQFMRGEKRAPIVLASLPGSGNTWVRGLLEKATGICTGTIYCDVNLRRTMFNGEGVRTGSVLVVKTHRSRFSWTDTDKPQKLTAEQLKVRVQPKFGAAILLLRNPYHAMVAEWNRKNCLKSSKDIDVVLDSHYSIVTHTGIVDEQHFGNNSDWSSLIKTMMQNWKNYIINVILRSPPHLPKLVVHYEDFQGDRVREVSRVLDFLNFPYSRETLSQRLEEDFSTFHRNKHVEFEPYTQSQAEFVERCLREMIGRLSSGNRGDTLGIEKYLRK